MNDPGGVAVDFVGNLYIADICNNRIRKVSNGVINTVAGNGTQGFSGDNGPAPGAQLNQPCGVTVDSVGNLYIADTANDRIRELSNGVIITVAGNGTPGFGGDNGPSTGARLNQPFGVALDSAGNLYIADSGNNRVRKVSNGVIATVAGNGTATLSGDNGPATSAQLNQPLGVAVDSAGNLYIAESTNSRIRKVANGLITTVAGNGTRGFSGDNGPAASSQLDFPRGVATGSVGNLYIADSDNHRIREVSNGVITTVAGGGSSFGDNGPATSAQLDPSGVAVDRSGNLYIADANGSRVRKVSNGVITTVAGGGTQLGENGPATSAQFYTPLSVTADSTGNLYVADTWNNRIRKVSNGVITTVVGSGPCTGFGFCGFAGDDGPATNAQLNNPYGVAVDSAGNLYIADTNNNRVRKVSNGVITTVAGNGTQGASGDNGPAIGAQLTNPSGVAVDLVGNLYIADSNNNRVRKVSNGIITTVAGNGTVGSNGDGGPATGAQLYFPTGIALDSAGNLYISDSNHNRIRKVSNGVITTIGGNGTPGFGGDGGPAINAQLNYPNGVAVDSAGTLYIADELNMRVRILTPTVPSINAGGVVNAASFAAQSPVAPGSIATVYGSFLVNSLASAVGTPLPNMIAGLSMQFGNGLKAPLFAVSGAQVNFQVPWELAVQSQSPLSATVNGQTSASQNVNIAPFAPGIFSMNAQGTGQAAILDSSYRLVDSSNPATAGSTVIQIYCTGLGAVTNQPASGSAALSNPLSSTTTTPTVMIGGAQASVVFSGLAPGTVGEYQVNALVPAGSSRGGAVPVVIAIEGATSNTVTIAVQ